MPPSTVSPIATGASRRSGPATALREIAILSHVLEVAMRDWGMPRARNPAKAIRRPQVGDARERPLQDDEEAPIGRCLLSPMSSRWTVASFWAPWGRDGGYQDRDAGLPRYCLRPAEGSANDLCIFCSRNHHSKNIMLSSFSRSSSKSSRSLEHSLRSLPRCFASRFCLRFHSNFSSAVRPDKS